MDTNEIYRPWLAAHIVSLLGPPIPIPIMNSWTQRGLVTNMGNRHPGKNTRRVYSLLSAVQMHAMYAGTSSGLMVQIALPIGDLAMQRLLGCNDPETEGRASLNTEERLLLCHVVGKTLHGAFLTPHELADELQRTGMTHPAAFGFVLEVDALIERVWLNYHDITPELNEKALAGSLKPFPKSLTEGLAIV